tara:strand:- start:783 stop:1166 length:384 start_codon:yes stop_codon:yes gene_type:complete
MSVEKKLIAEQIENIEKVLDKLVVSVAVLKELTTPDELLNEQHNLFMLLSNYTHIDAVRKLRKEIVRNLKANGYSQVTIANVLEVAQSQVSRWLNESYVTDALEETNDYIAEAYPSIERVGSRADVV